MSLPKYANDHGFSTVGRILNDGALRRLNEDIQLDYIEPTWETFQVEMGLTEDDLIRVPMLFEEAPQCGGYTATLIPSTLNMVVATNSMGQVLISSCRIHSSEVTSVINPLTLLLNTSMVFCRLETPHTGLMIGTSTTCNSVRYTVVQIPFAPQ